MAQLRVAGRLLVVALVVLPLVRATAVAGTDGTQSVRRLVPDRTTALSVRVGPASPTAFTWHVVLGPTESLTRLGDGRIAVLAPWPPDLVDPEDENDTNYPTYPVPEAPPLSSSDPYRFSADPDGSMAADEAMHDVGPFDPAYADEYIPDPGRDDPDDLDSPENANSGPPPGPDTSDPVEPSDSEPVSELDPLDALNNVEAARSDQFVALISAPYALDALNRRIPARLTVAGPDMIELTAGPALIAPAYPLVVTSSIVFNPDALR
jgi:hypothetical protein